MAQSCNGNFCYRAAFLPVSKIDSQSKGRGCFSIVYCVLLCHVLIVCHVWASITNTLYMISSPTWYDKPLSDTEEAAIPRCCTKISFPTYFSSLILTIVLKIYMWNNSNLVKLQAYSL